MIKYFILFSVVILACYACDQGEIPLLVTKVYGNKAWHESCEVWDGNIGTGKLLGSFQGEDEKDWTYEQFEACILPGNISIAMHAKYGNGWGSDSYQPYVEIMIGRSKYYKTYMPYRFDETYEHDNSTTTISLTDPFGSLWKLSDIPYSSPVWTKPSFDDSDWSTYPGGSLPVLTEVTRYYRRQVSIQDIENISTFYFNFYTNGGVILYIQGQEIYRKNLPKGEINPYTYAVGIKQQNITLQTIAISKHFFHASTSITIALEIHLFDFESFIPVNNLDPFDAFLSPFIMKNSSCTNSLFYYGTGDSIPEGEKGHKVNTVFQEISSSYFTTNKTHTPVFYYILPNHLSEVITSYSVMSSLDTAYSDPLSWSIYGSVDNNTWFQIDYQENVHFKLRQEKHVYSLISNYHPFSIYKLEILTVTEGWGLGIGHWLVYTCNDNTIKEGLYYDSEMYYIHDYVDIVSIPPKSTGYKNYYISPALPKGLSIDYVTGVITGKTTIGTVSHESNAYTVMATDRITQTEGEFTFNITIVSCSSDLTRLHIHKVNKAWAQSESFSFTDIYTNITIWSSPKLTDLVDYDVDLCIPASTYHLHLGSSFYSYWLSGSLLVLQMYDTTQYYTIGRYTVRQEEPIHDYLLDFTFIIHFQSTSFLYSQDIVYPGWETDTFHPSMFMPYIPSSPPTSTSTRWFFRTQFILPSLDNYAGFVIRLFYKAGCAIFVNGNELYRRNIPSDPINNNTAATAGDDSFLYRTISGPLSILKEGNNTLAIFYVQQVNKNPNIVKFDCSLQMFYSHGTTGRMWDVTVTDSPNGKNPNNLIDRNTYSYYINTLPQGDHVNLFFKYGNTHAEYINEYCIRSSDIVPDWDPSDWSIYVSNSDQYSTLLGTVQNTVFMNRLYERCFTLPYHIKAWHNYKIVLEYPRQHTAQPYQYKICEITMRNDNITKRLLPPFSMIPSNLTAYVHATMPSYKASSSLYSQYTYKSESYNMTLDTSSGQLFGIIPETKEEILPRTEEIQISAVTPQDTTVTTSILVQKQYCNLPNVLITVYLHTQNATGTLSLSIKDKNQKVISNYKGFTAHQNYTYPFCLPHSIYYILLSDSENKGIGEGYVEVQLENGYTILHGSMGNQESFRVFYLNLNYVITPLHDIWSFYNTKNTTIQDGWNTISYDDSDWLHAMPIHFSSSTYNTESYNIYYFRHSFQITDISIETGIYVNLQTKYCLIVYINGEELYHDNLLIQLDQSILCKEIFISPSVSGSSISTSSDSIQIGINIIAVELYVPNDGIVDLDGSVLLLNEDTPLLSQWTVEGDQEGDLSIPYVYDNNIGTITLSGPRCIGATLLFTYNSERKEVFNRYSVITGSTCNARNPSDWILEGSNDNGETWTLLHIAHNITYPLYEYEETFDFYNDLPYHSIRYTVTGCNNVHIYPEDSDEEKYCKRDSKKYGFQLAEIAFFEKTLNVSCEEIYGYGKAVEGQLKEKNCLVYYEGKQLGMCTDGIYIDVYNNCTLLPPNYMEYPSILIHQYETISIAPTMVCGAEYTCSITPSLPDSLLFSSLGIISGTLFNEPSILNYTVVCANIKGFTSTNITIEYYEYQEPKNVLTWEYCLLLASILLLLITGLILIYIKCRQPQISKINEEQNAPALNDKNHIYEKLIEP
ncbi:hypothetical protein WA158_007605 [Blastocystis sp. Blastoise]